ncbi:unnamed protein product [Protopolystoma xenopodis]|uniref:Uncharacterized protein n=1 Tax=Protopolystoma xenopodis TaxID=117903 RepID=A0A3S5ATP9_9PLAT|nr:unnamed protein product [Protopolystoma xenopodis]
MAILTDDADYAGETFGNVPRPRFNFGNDHADNGPKRLGMFHVHGSTLEMIMQTMDPGRGAFQGVFLPI